MNLPVLFRTRSHQSGDDRNTYAAEMSLRLTAVGRSTAVYVSLSRLGYVLTLSRLCRFAPDGPPHTRRRPLACMVASSSRTANIKSSFSKQHAKHAYVSVWTLWHPCEAISRARKVCQSPANRHKTMLPHGFAFSRPGGHGGVPPPVPIPNTAVKNPSANGTSSQDAGE